MLIDKIGSHTVERYASIDEIPIDRFMSFNRLVFLEEGIGADVEKIDEKDKAIIRLIRQNRLDDAVQMVKNRNEAMRWVLDHINPGMMCYVPLIKSIDGKDIYDYSDDACRRWLKQFSQWGANKGFINSIIEFTKKKFQEEIDIYIPEKLSDAELKAVYGKRKKRLILLLEKIIDPSIEMDEEIAAINDFLIGLVMVKNYSGAKGEEAQFINRYDEMSFIISSSTSQSPLEMTARIYLKTLESIKKQAKANKSKNKKK